MTEFAENSKELSALRDRIRQQERELLRRRDEVIGLEAQLSRLVEGHLSNELRDEISRIKSSASYRLGQGMTAPVRFLGKALNALRRRVSGAVHQTRKNLNKR